MIQEYDSRDEFANNLINEINMIYVIFDIEVRLGRNHQAVQSFKCMYKYIALTGRWLKIVKFTLKSQNPFSLQPSSEETTEHKEVLSIIMNSYKTEIIILYFELENDDKHSKHFKGFV